MKKLTTIKTVNVELNEIRLKEKQLLKQIKNDYTKEVIYFISLLVVVSILVTTFFKQVTNKLI